MSQNVGKNSLDFIDVQLDFSAHIRNPEKYNKPADVDHRHMQIYLDLFFNNVNNFLSTTFPVAKSLLSDQQWLELVRAFFHQHPSQSPYFLQISEEFLTFLSEKNNLQLPDFYLELCHYEWVEMSLDVMADEDIPEVLMEPELNATVVINPYSRCLVYEYPVHNIGPSYQPDAKPHQPTFLIVLRNMDHEVRFVASNPLTHQLLQLLAEHTVLEATKQLHEMLSNQGRQLSLEQVRSQGMEVVLDLYRQQVLLGAL